MERSFIVFSNRKDRVTMGEILAAMAARGTPVEWQSMYGDETPEEAAAWKAGAFYPEGEKRDTTRIDASFQTAEDHFVVEDFRKEIIDSLADDAQKAALASATGVYKLGVRVSLVKPGTSFEAAFARTLLNLILFLAEGGQSLIGDEDETYHLAADYPSHFRVQ